MHQLKPEPIPGNNANAVEIPSGLNYRVIYMYSDKPEYQMFTKNEPNDEYMKTFAGMAPKPFEEGDGIIVLDSNNKTVNHLMLKGKSIGTSVPPGELSPMTMEKQSSKTKEQPLNEQFRRMQKIAGIITESQLNESRFPDQNLKDLQAQQDILEKVSTFYREKAKKLGVDRKLIGDFNQAINALEAAIFKANYDAVDENQTNESEINIGQENVIKQYLSKLRKFEQDNTADMADLKNLETAINMYHKELLNKIK
jgi:hypothetical protein